MRSLLGLKKLRSRNISAPAYKLSLKFRQGGTFVSGNATIVFNLKSDAVGDLKRLRSLLWIDFLGQVKRLTLNGKKLRSPKDFTAKGGKIVLKASALRLVRINDNKFEIDYFAPFGSEKNASALVHFHDHIDGRDYYYTKKPPFKAASLFPCFDQPDILGIHEVQVEAPLAWTAVTSTLCTRKKRLAKTQEWHYEKSIPYPSYQFCILVGPFDEWVGPPPEDGETPLIFYGRKSLKKFAQWLDLGMCVRHPKDFDFFRKGRPKGQSARRR